MTEVNVVLLKETMAEILKSPLSHDQGVWVDPCGSTMCFAGHAATIAGATFDPQIYRDEDTWTLDAKTGKHVYWDYNHPTMHVSEFAQNKLGLSDIEQSYLFSPSRTVEELQDAVKMFEEGYRLDGSYSWNRDF